MASAAKTAGFAELAAWLLETACAAHPDDSVVMRALAEVLEEQGDVCKALEWWETIARAEPRDSMAGRKVRDLAAIVATGTYYAARKAQRATRARSVKRQAGSA